MNFNIIYNSKIIYIKPYINSSQLSWAGHIPFALWIVEKIKPQSIVELGTHVGNSYFALCESVKFNELPTRCYAIDTWQGDLHTGYYSDDVYLSVKNINDRYYSTFSNLLRMTFDEAVNQFSDGYIDLLHIDGLHTYEAVKHDFETWLPKLSDRAVVLFHDISVRNNSFGVWRLWEELSVNYKHINFNHSNGLGVLFVGKLQPSSVDELFMLWEKVEGRINICNFFEILGRSIEVELVNSNLNKVIADRDFQLAERELQIESIFNTYSWRITSPLRWLSNKLIKSISF